MSKKLYEENSIQDIANAIRSQNGTNNPYTVAQMGNAIRAIKTQPNLESLTANQNGTYTPSQGKDGFSEVSVQVSGVGANLKTLIATEDDIYIPSNNYDGFNLVMTEINPYGLVNVNNSNLIVNGSITPTSVPLNDDIINDGYKSSSTSSYFAFKLSDQWPVDSPFIISMIGKFDNTAPYNHAYITFNGSNDGSGGEFVINNTAITWYAYGTRSSVQHNLVWSNGAEYLFSLKFDFISNKISYVLALTESSDVFTYEYEYDLTNLLNRIQDLNTIIAINRNPHSAYEYSNATVNSIIIQGLPLSDASGVSF